MPPTPTVEKPKTTAAKPKNMIGCTRCKVGVAYKVSGDENGSSYRCFNCGLTAAIPAKEDGAGAHLGNVNKDTDEATLRNVIEQIGGDTSELKTRAELLDAADDLKALR